MVLSLWRRCLSDRSIHGVGGYGLVISLQVLLSDRKQFLVTIDDDAKGTRGRTKVSK